MISRLARESGGKSHRWRTPAAGLYTPKVAIGVPSEECGVGGGGEPAHQIADDQLGGLAISCGRDTHGHRDSSAVGTKGRWAARL